MRRGTVLLCTLGPSSLNPEVIGQLEKIGVYSFRLNMSHTDLGELERDIELIRRSSHVPVCIDTEGSQIRTGVMAPGVSVQAGASVRLVPDAVEGTSSTIPLTPSAAIARLAPSARMSIDFDSVVVQLDRVADGAAEGTVVVGGEVGTRKAVTVYPSPPLPAFSEKDRAALRIGTARGVDQYALSFCEQPSSVRELREVVGPKATVMAKIESRAGVRNLARIAEVADALLIDRGDLSREVRVEAIPLLQKTIIRKANALGVPVYVATNLLESMVTRRTPTRAEVNDVMSTLLDGADGLVLASETAIGKYPVSAAQMIRTLIREYEQSVDGYRVDELLGEHPLAADHGRRFAADHD